MLGTQTTIKKKKGKGKKKEVTKRKIYIIADNNHNSKNSKKIRTQLTNNSKQCYLCLEGEFISPEITTGSFGIEAVSAYYYKQLITILSYLIDLRNKLMTMQQMQLQRNNKRLERLLNNFRETLGIYEELNQTLIGTSKFIIGFEQYTLNYVEIALKNYNYFIKWRTSLIFKSITPEVIKEAVNKITFFYKNYASIIIRFFEDMKSDPILKQYTGNFFTKFDQKDLLNYVSGEIVEEQGEKRVRLRFVMDLRDQIWCTHIVNIHNSVENLQMPIIAFVGASHLDADGRENYPISFIDRLREKLGSTVEIIIERAPKHKTILSRVNLTQSNHGQFFADTERRTQPRIIESDRDNKIENKQHQYRQRGGN